MQYSVQSEAHPPVIGITEESEMGWSEVPQQMTGKDRNDRKWYEIDKEL